MNNRQQKRLRLVLAGQNEKSKMYQGSAPMTREIEMPDEYRRYLAGRPNILQWPRRKMPTTHDLTNTYHTQTID